MRSVVRCSESLCVLAAATALAAAVAATAGCGGGSGPGPNLDTGPSADASPDASADTDPGASPDDLVPDPTGVEDVGATEPGTTDVAPDADVLTPDADAAQPDTAGCDGAPGCPCTDGAQCASGACIDTPSGSECAGPCDEGCPAGWACLPAPGGPGATLVCVAPSQLCRPCKADLDCEGPLPGNHLCVPSGSAGSFCGASCAGSGACPDGFTCADVPTAGGTARQCVPAGETSCPCLDRFAGLKTTCYAANEYGKCLAERTCADACPAATPAAESCNGADDDCDGATDEQDAAGCQDRFADGDSDGWGAGAPACLCATTVQFPVSQGGDCRDDDPEIHPGAAVCGKDGDCDGDLIDVGEECDDGNDVPNDTCKDCKFPCPAGTAYVGTYCWVMQAHWEETRWEACARVGKEATKGEPPYANNEAVFPPSVKWGPEIEKQIADGLGYPLGDGPYNYFSLPRMWCSPPLGKCSAKGPYESFYSNESYKSPDPPWRNVVTCLP